MATTTIERLETADGRPLKAALAQAERRKRIRAVLLVMPLFAFIFCMFLYPIGLMLFRSIDNPLVPQNMPRTIVALENWEPTALPGEETYAALVKDLIEARDSGNIGKVATRLNYETGGLRSTITRTGRRAERLEPPFKEKLIELNADWGKIETWSTIKLLSDRYSLVQYVAALDHTFDPLFPI